MPKLPPLWVCQYNGSPRAFYCINTDTNERKKIVADDPEMKAAQCLSIDDFKKASDWVEELRRIAEARCK